MHPDSYRDGVLAFWCLIFFFDFSEQAQTLSFELYFLPVYRQAGTFNSELPFDKDLTCFENDPVYYWSNPDYSQCYVSIILSADQAFQQSSIKLFPNPAGDFIQLELNVPGQTEGCIKIFDQAGILIRVFESYSENPVSYDITDLKPGFYFLKYISPDNEITTGFVKIQL